MIATIRQIEYYFPEGTLTNADLKQAYPDWTVEKIEKKTGVHTRYIAGEKECATDLAVRAVSKLIDSSKIPKNLIDYILFCTQSPDYFLPTSACLLQHRLHLSKHVGALDFNLGCSGYIYGLSIAKALIETGQARVILLITAETYSKYIHPEDRSVRSIFGDAASATLIVGERDDNRVMPDAIGPFVFGTDGSGGENLIVPVGGHRHPNSSSYQKTGSQAGGSVFSGKHLYMNGPALFNFALQEIPGCVHRLLEISEKTPSDIDRFIFHQANGFILEHLRQKLKIPAEKFFIDMQDGGNTVSCTIPIALKRAQMNGWLEPGQLIMLVGFGVGYSWGATLIRLHY